MGRRQDWINGVALGPLGVLTCSNDGMLALRSVHTRVGQRARGQWAAGSPGGGGNARVHRALDAAEATTVRLQGHQSLVNAVALDGGLAASGSTDGEVRVRAWLFSCGGRHDVPDWVRCRRGL